MLGLTATCAQENGVEASSQPGNSPSKTVVRFRHTWSEHFTLLSAVRTDNRVTAVHAMHDGSDGLCRYVVVGDADGHVNIFKPQGDLVYEFVTEQGSPVTAVASHQLRTNESLLLTGHADGSLRVYMLHQQYVRDIPAGQDVFTPTGIALQHVLVAPAAGASCATNECSQACSDSDQPAPVVLLDASSSGPGRQQFTAAHAVGSINLWRSNGTLRAHTTGSALPLAMRAGINTAVLTVEGLSSIRGRGSNITQHALSCRDLNGSRLVAAAWSEGAPTSKQPGPVSWRGFAVTEEAELLTMSLGHGSQAGRHCQVRHRRSMTPSTGGIALASVKDYLLAVSSEAVSVFNLTLNVAHYGPHDVLTEPLASLAAAFGQQVAPVAQPLIATNGKRLVAVQLADQLVAIYQSNLPTTERHSFNHMVAWARPIAILAMIAIGTWQFSSRSRRVREDDMDMPFGQEDLHRAFGASLGGLGPHGNDAGMDWPAELAMGPGRSLGGGYTGSGSRERSRSRAVQGLASRDVGAGRRREDRGSREAGQREALISELDNDMVRALQNRWADADANDALHH
ncbi:hypothetical protein WJX72_005442 [[Myrmecia] bisecta]|uniref:Uncharacterized protein n=1 Tax=[Myrmecia] bisecta TaxID=41462 RepID=A0AAW1PJZ4_9CHLO